ncbi:hypothetical protein DFH11DRAFT_1734773 [Phellopilus nigrolimitatus]|nr:hypothetical protein DFH11DRAFT_1734773 [Phellopilus nigrolimitatus]
MNREAAALIDSEGMLDREDEPHPPADADKCGAYATCSPAYGRRLRRDRGALLAHLELEKRVRENGLGSDFESQDGLLDLIKLYFGRFDEKARFFEDFKPYTVLEEARLTHFFVRLSSPSLIQTCRTYGDMSLGRMNCRPRRGRSARIPARTVALGLDSALPEMEMQPTDDLVLLAVQKVVSLWGAQNDVIWLYMTASILKYAAQHSKNSYLVGLQFHRLLSAQYSRCSTIMPRADSLACGERRTLTQECVETSQITLRPASSFRRSYQRSTRMSPTSSHSKTANSLQCNLVKIKLVRMHLEHDCLSTQLADTELIVYLRPHPAKLSAPCQPTFDPQTLMMNSPGPGWLSTFLCIYIRVFLHASDIDGTVEEKLLIGYRPKVADISKKIPLKECMHGRKEPEFNELTADKRKLIDYVQQGELVFAAADKWPEAAPKEPSVVCDPPEGVPEIFGYSGTRSVVEKSRGREEDKDEEDRHDETTRIAVLGLCRTAIKTTSATIIFMLFCSQHRGAARLSSSSSTFKEFGAARPLPLLSRPQRRAHAYDSDEAAVLLDSEEGHAIAKTSLVVDELRRGLVRARGDFAAEGERTRAKLVEKNARNCLEFLAVLDATFASPVDADKVREARGLIRQLQMRMDGATVMLCLRSWSLRSARAKTGSDLAKLQNGLLGLIKLYFERFGDKAFCFEDLKLYTVLEGYELLAHNAYLDGHTHIFYAARRSKNSYLGIHRLLSAPSIELQHYRALRVKEVQIDMLVMCPRVRGEVLSRATSRSHKNLRSYRSGFVSEKYLQVTNLIAFEDRLDNSLQHDLVKIEHMRMRLAHEGPSTELADTELIELFDRITSPAHSYNHDLQVMSNYQPRGQPTFDAQTLMMNASGFLRIYIRVFLLESDIDETVEKLLVIGNRSKITDISRIRSL